MTRPVTLVRILCALALLLEVSCQSGDRRADGQDPSLEAGAASGTGSSPTRTGGADARREGDGWVWTVPRPAWAGMPAADERDIALTYGHQHLVLLDDEGRLQWDVHRLGLRDVAPRLGSELVLVATDEGVAAFARSDGSKVWDTGLAERANTPVIAGRMAVTSTWEGAVVAFDLASGTVAWRVALPGPALGPPATDGATVVVTWDRADLRSGGAVALDAATGRQRWAATLPGGGISAPALIPAGSAGSAVIVAGDLAAHALDLASGHERWRAGVDGAGSPEVPPLAVQGGSVLVAHRLGGLDLLDAATGLRTWNVATDGAAVRGAPAAGPDGSYAFPLHDGRVLLAGPSRETELVRPPAGRISGVATGPGGFLVATTRESTVNTVEAGPAW